eukprot:13265592-Ditylum_brightwellii.AAC.2
MKLPSPVHSVETVDDSPPYKPTQNFVEVVPANWDSKITSFLIHPAKALYTPAHCDNNDSLC